MVSHIYEYIHEEWRAFILVLGEKSKINTYISRFFGPQNCGVFVILFCTRIKKYYILIHIYKRVIWLVFLQQVLTLFLVWRENYIGWYFYLNIYNWLSHYCWYLPYHVHTHWPKFYHQHFDDKVVMSPYQLCSEYIFHYSKNNPNPHKYLSKHSDTTCECLSFEDDAPPLWN